MGWLRGVVAVLALAAMAGAIAATRLAHRALPRTDGVERGTGILGGAEIVRDLWGVPHIFAGSDDDAYFALGWVHAQDRLFQMDLTRHLGQGRLSELFGAKTLRSDRLFRTMEFHRTGQRMLAEARPEARRAAEAYCRGVNASVASLNGRLPIEFAILRHEFEPAKADDFVGVLGYMSWGLNMSWDFDPLYEKLVAKLGAAKAAELFPYNFGGVPSAFPTPPPPELRISLFQLSPDEDALLASVPTLRASNNWVLGPSKTTSGMPILANDPHLSHGVPGIWYEAHLHTPTLDVMGVTMPGFPAVVIGHDREVAWGFTNVMLDAADFFVEKLRPGPPGQVMSRGQWLPIEERREQIQVKGAAPETLLIRRTPHGPLVSDLMPGAKDALSYQWNYHAALDANEVDGFYALDRARSWGEFRAAVARFGAVAQNAAYADREGHIGMQTTGRIPRYKEPKLDGQSYRIGWDGSEDWDGFHPFEENPSLLDPPQGWLASANNPTVGHSRYYISNQWEPVDRYLRIKEMIEAKAKLSIEDVKRMQMDTVFVSAREEAPMILDAFAAEPPRDATARAALALLAGWDGDMRKDAAAPALFAAFYRRLFYAIFEDELGPELARGYRAKANLSAVMIGAVMSDASSPWFDRVDTPAVEDRAAILRTAWLAAVRELRGMLGDDPRSWTWGRLHSLTMHHALGRGSRLLGLYFDRGPFAVSGTTSTVNKMEFGEADFSVLHGPSMRQITDLGDLNRSLAVLPMGESGIPASPHYDDMLPLWLAGEYHPFPIGRAAIEQSAAAHLTLAP
jgi:penicillin amidase